MRDTTFDSPDDGDKGGREAADHELLEVEQLPLPGDLQAFWDEHGYLPSPEQLAAEPIKPLQEILPMCGPLKKADKG